MRPDPPAPWCWPLFDRDQAAAWGALARWVEHVLAPGYELTRGQLLDCWAHHPRLVAELSGLRHGYLEAMRRGAAAHQSADWHARALPAALATIGAVAHIAGCGPDHHHASPGAGPRADGFLTEALAVQPAIRKHWDSAWQEAVIADLPGRRPALGT